MVLRHRLRFKESAILFTLKNSQISGSSNLSSSTAGNGHLTPVYGEWRRRFHSKSVSDLTVYTIRKCFCAAELAGATIVYSAATRCSSIDGDRIQKLTATDDPAAVQQTEEQETANKAKIVSFSCGNAGHDPKKCPFKTHCGLQSQ